MYDGGSDMFCSCGKQPRPSRVSLTLSEVQENPHKYRNLLEQASRRKESEFSLGAIFHQRLSRLNSTFMEALPSQRYQPKESESFSKKNFHRFHSDNDSGREESLEYSEALNDTVAKEALENAEAFETIPGMIFGCTSKTELECFQRKLFGLPRSNWGLVKRLVPGSVLFLFNFQTKELYGTFRATSRGCLDIEPKAYQGKGKFPCQVRVALSTADNIEKEAGFEQGICTLTEPEFRSVIADNYFSSKKFHYGLNEQQVEGLINRFHMKRASIHHQSQLLAGIDCRENKWTPDSSPPPRIHARRSRSEKRVQRHAESISPKRMRSAEAVFDSPSVVQRSHAGNDRSSVTVYPQFSRSRKPWPKPLYEVERSRAKGRQFADVESGHRSSRGRKHNKHGAPSWTSCTGSHPMIRGDRARIRLSESSGKVARHFH